MQRCRQQVMWNAESQASLADLECHLDGAEDRAASGKVSQDQSSCQLLTTSSGSIAASAMSESDLITASAFCLQHSVITVCMLDSKSHSVPLPEHSSASC